MYFDLYKSSFAWDKQILSVEIFDKELFGTFLRGHLSLKSVNNDQILPQIISFVILRAWDVNSRKGSILDYFWLMYEENEKVQEIQVLTSDGVMDG